MKTIYEPGRKVPVICEADIVVVGSGPAGVSAAVSAARNGAKKVALVERYGVIGGMATGGYVTVLPYLSNGDKVEVAGMQQEWIDRLRKKPCGVLGPDAGDVGRNDKAIMDQWRGYYDMLWNGVLTYGAYADPEILKVVLDEMVQEAKVDVYLHCWACKAIAEEGKMTGVIFESKEGRKAIKGTIVIDATGDGDIFASAGESFDKERNYNLRNSMLALVFRIADVDFKAFADYEEFHSDEWFAHREEIQKMVGFLMVPYPTTKESVIIVNNYVPNHDCLSVKDMTEVEMMVRSGAMKALAYLREHVPGFENGYLMDFAAQLGTRGSRRLNGEYTVTIDDLRQGRQHEDVIGVVPPINHEIGKKSAHIPYRALLPKYTDSLIVAGRCYSSDIVANNWTNLIPHCITMGEAAGAAAVIALDAGIQPRAIDVDKLQRILKAQNVYLG